MCATEAGHRVQSARTSSHSSSAPQADAYLGMHRLAEAEKSGLKAAEIDKTNFEPRTHFLLAQIYEVERKPDAEAAQLGEYLKSVNDPPTVSVGDNCRIKSHSSGLSESARGHRR